MEGIYKNLEGDAREEWAKLTTTIIASELKCATCNNIIEKKSQPEVCLEIKALNRIVFGHSIISVMKKKMW